MAKLKNAKRQHHIAEYDPTAPATAPTGEAWLKIGKYIQTADNENDEDTDDVGYFDGDGEPETIVNSIKKGRSFEGLRDSTDPAQNLVADLELETERKVWYKETTSDGSHTFQGVATVTDIQIGDGDATEYEPISFKVTFVGKPTKTAVTPTQGA